MWWISVAVQKPAPEQTVLVAWLDEQGRRQYALADWLPHWPPHSPSARDSWLEVWDGRRVRRIGGQVTHWLPLESPANDPVPPPPSAALFPKTFGSRRPAQPLKRAGPDPQDD